MPFCSSKIGSKIYGPNDSLETIFDILMRFSVLQLVWWPQYVIERVEGIQLAIRTEISTHFT